jgi:hypothetical protein
VDNLRLHRQHHMSVENTDVHVSARPTLLCDGFRDDGFRDDGFRDIGLHSSLISREESPPSSDFPI